MNWGFVGFTWALCSIGWALCSIGWAILAGVTKSPEAHLVLFGCVYMTCYSMYEHYKETSE